MSLRPVSNPRSGRTSNTYSVLGLRLLYFQSDNNCIYQPRRLSYSIPDCLSCPCVHHIICKFSNSPRNLCKGPNDIPDLISIRVIKSLLPLSSLVSHFNCPFLLDFERKAKINVILKKLRDDNFIYIHGDIFYLFYSSFPIFYSPLLHQSCTYFHSHPKPKRTKKSKLSYSVIVCATLCFYCYYCRCCSVIMLFPSIIRRSNRIEMSLQQSYHYYNVYFQNLNNKKCKLLCFPFSGCV